MTQLSRERLEEIAELARKATYKPCAMHMTNLIAVCDSEVIEEMARRLLAVEGQEPVAWVTEDLGRLFVKIHYPTTLKAGDKLYRHAQPVVPDGLVKAVEFYEQVKRENPPVETGAWKDAVDWVLKEACRAAMLNGGNDE
ncbi:hypothetical protein N6B35_16525 [Klebsiella michiganensis]|uniref:hypothetical protein n=1 Tax=Klebsiella michiganensis TaxID=1134687 RepID=UPI0021D7E981|nr:hypothetical protein [Klebsiella michiganensis]UYB54941.1 hypothetical protein N6B35_16525 [Klebsiella michiganensis]